MHAILLADGRGSSKAPGEFRRSQNWIGGTRPGNAIFVPPPPESVLDCLDALEKFWHDIPERQPALIKAALSHVQFETIHPFLDGNGRLGRLLITLLLCVEGALQQPTLYLSLYFKTHRATYYELLQKVRTDGDWESWLRFFLNGVLETAEQAVETAARILHLFETDQRQIEVLGRAASSVLRVHQVLQRTPLTSIASAARQTKLSVPTITAAMNHLQNLGLVRELTSRSRNRLFAYDNYIKLLNQGTEPLS
jgi:Fic family protein